MDPPSTETFDDADAMDPVERRRRIDRLLDRALDLPSAQRDAFLAEECSEELRDDVARLLATLTDEDSETWAEGAFHGALARDLAADMQRQMPLEPDEVVDSYRIVRELGRGGMAVVYLAERIDGAFRRQVALKVVREPSRNPKLTERFHLERHILAELRHPNIAQLLDGGLTSQGQPYFVMEWVDGPTIVAYCDEHRLPVNERLRLFAQAARAVAAAHRSLVIHRDIKPSNILVIDDRAEAPSSPRGADSQDGDPREGDPWAEEPRVKLLDFGIAKVLDPDRLDESLKLTRTAALPMTPEYASPEQLLGEPLTTASDIYQLGILLFQLLCGRKPFENLSFVERIAEDREPSRPSTFFTHPQTEAIAERRSTTRRALRRELSGELETIALTALRREPERRYASAMDLVHDVEAYLEGRPIRARADSLAYRTRKFVGRNLWASTVVAALVLTLVTVLLLSTVRLRRERDAAQEARDRAEASSAESEQMVDFLLGLFEVSQKGAVRAESITALDLLEQGTKKIETELRDQPRIRARLLTTLSGVYRDLTLFEPAEAMAREAVTLTEHLYGPYSLETATSLDRLGGILIVQDRLDEAEPLLRRASAILDAEATDGPEAAASWNSLATVYWRQGRYEEVEPLLRRSLELRAETLGPDHQETAAVHKNLCILLRTLNRLDDAEPHCRRRWKPTRRPSARGIPRWPARSTPWPCSGWPRAATTRPSPSTGKRSRSGGNPSGKITSTPPWPCKTWPASTCARSATGKRRCSIAAPSRSPRRPTVPIT